MSEWLTFIVDAFAVMSGWEIFAALLGMAYIIFASRESQWCWPLAFISTLIYTILFWEGQLPMQALLNFYYIGMAIYGYLLWRKHGLAKDNLAITSWSWNKQLIFISIGTVLSLITAYYLKITETSQHPYLDASVTIFSVMNTFLMAKKVMQTWLYWVVIDAAAVVLYAQSGFYATVILFAVYTVLAMLGYINWQKSYRQQTG
ncbi:nicotinamide riboside transporter PnuC [Pseudomonadota bacterium]|nr:nicotinamide riboside transporter PnuC [Pseudomonadota bacterium]